MLEEEEIGSKTRSVVLDPDLAAAVAEAAKRQGQIPESAVIRDWLRRGRAAYEHERNLLRNLNERRELDREEIPA